MMNGRSPRILGLATADHSYTCCSRRPRGPSETYSVSVTLRARHGCQESLQQVLYVDYYITGTGVNEDYLIWWDVLLPLVMRNAP